MPPSVEKQACVFEIGCPDISGNILVVGKNGHFASIGVRFDLYRNLDMQIPNKKKGPPEMP